MRRSKRLVLVLAVVLAMGTVEASAASANQFHSSATNTTVTVASNETQRLNIEAGGQTIQCTTVGGSGQASASTVSEVTFKPIYSGCTVSGIGGSTAEVSMNECDYTFTIEATKNEGPAHVACNGTSQITITVKVIGISFCTVHIGKQTPSGNSKYANSGTKQIKEQPNQTGISSTRQGSSECGAATSTQGSYQGSVTVKGEITGQQTEAAIQVG